MSLQCQRCDEQFSTKYTLLKHLNRKKTCIPLTIEKAISVEILIKELTDKKIEGKTYECKYCNKKFADASNKCHHQSNCKKKKTTTSQETTSHVTNITNIDNSITNNGTINNFHITINGLGKETADYLTEENVKNLLINKFDGIMKLLELKHFSDEHPENNNLRKGVHKDKFIQYINDDSKWKSKDKDSVLKNVFANMGKDLTVFLNENKNMELGDFSEEQQIQLLKKFMSQVGLPLDWFKLYETKFFQQFKPDLDIPHPIDFSYCKKIKKEIFNNVTENIYQFSKSKECPF